MKQAIFMALIVFSIASCTQPGDSATTTTTSPDSSTNGAGVYDSSTMSNAPTGINGDTAMQHQGISAGSPDTSRVSRTVASGLGTVDTATGGSQNNIKSRKVPKDSSGRKRN